MESLLFVAFGPLVVLVLRWRVVRTIRKCIDITGPAKDHFFKGLQLPSNLPDGLRFNLNMSEQYGGAVRVHVLLGEEQLYVSDPRTLHHIIVKEQHIYNETDAFLMTNKLIFGTQHKKQRKMLNPVFSLANMRDLLPIIQPIADQLLAALLTELPPDGEKEINIIPLMSRTALEYICQAGMGYTFNTLESGTTSYPTAMRIIMLRPFIPHIVRGLPLRWCNALVDWVPMPALREMCEIVGTLDSVSKTIYAEKKAAMDGRATKGALVGGDLGPRMKGRDIISILLKANSSSSDADRLTEAELLGQMNTIIFAAFETTTVAIARLFYVLATRPDAQARLRNELRAAKQAHAVAGERWEDVALPYDALMGLPYLDAIVRETFRVYPPTSLMSRVTRQATVLPLEQPVRSSSGERISSIPLPEGTTVIVSILAANHNKEVWGEDASAWCPERWLTASSERIRIDAPSESKIKYPGVYASMMTFLGGGRACIGFKFAEMELKQVVATLLPALSLELPSEPDESGNVKEIYWKMNGLQVPVVRLPFGDDRTPQVPLTIRRVEERDFS
ncbi:cytochrome P450 [Laetiporus sulphureus 93-53]|uniref:Cytochrome P450 n=1 Tax=Laetiporus sulphureus 93-53 TaxID=1314785 RepID=A0A165DR77_9APHY|nr:cytochrome P450 [Laetiporus sulphureus 93-53]KZT05458.1 cytochrome P450 [Laetiporus sulphureus 93-53]